MDFLAADLRPPDCSRVANSKIPARVYEGSRIVRYATNSARFSVLSLGDGLAVDRAFDRGVEAAFLFLRISILERSVIKSSVIPSARLSCVGLLPSLAKGSTTNDGFSAVLPTG